MRIYTYAVCNKVLFGYATQQQQQLSDTLLVASYGFSFYFLSFFFAPTNTRMFAIVNRIDKETKRNDKKKRKEEEEEEAELKWKPSAINWIVDKIFRRSKFDWFFLVTISYRCEQFVRRPSSDGIFDSFIVVDTIT